LREGRLTVKPGDTALNGQTGVWRLSQAVRFSILAFASSQSQCDAQARQERRIDCIKWPGAALARYISQYPRARSFWSTTDGHSIAPSLGVGTRVARLRLPGLPAAIFAAVGFGFLPRCAIMFPRTRHTTLFWIVAKVFPHPSKLGRIAGKRLPAGHSDVDVAWVQFNGATQATTPFRCNDRCGLNQQMAHRRIGRQWYFLHGPAHAIRRAFCVPCIVWASCVRAADLPKRGLLSTTPPVSFAASRIPTRFRVGQ